MPSKLLQDANHLHKTFTGYIEFIEHLQLHLKKAQEEIHENDLIEYVTPRRLQLYATKINCGANITPERNYYSIEEILHFLNSALPPLDNIFYKD